MPQAEHLGVPETQVAGGTASIASADELSREVLHQSNLSEDSRNIYFLKDARDARPACPGYPTGNPAGDHRHLQRGEFLFCGALWHG